MSRWRALTAGLVGFVLAASLAVAMPGPVDAARTTADRTIVGGDREEGFAALAYGIGEKYRTRDALARPHKRRAKRRVALNYFSHISDLQLADEESPVRSEFFDGEPGAQFSPSGFRPQEALDVYAIDAAIRKVNRFNRSLHRDGADQRTDLRNAVLTGDLAENIHTNEVEWVRTLLEGGPLDPNSGTTDLTGTTCPPATPFEDPANYTGVQDYDDYVNDNTIFYDPDVPIGMWSAWPTYPGLMDRAQQPFEAAGLGVPSYIGLGNHDVLVSGVVAATPPLEDAALGCVKPYFPVGNPGTINDILDPVFLATALTSNPNEVGTVAPDPKRAFVDRAQYREIMAAGSDPEAHGFGLIDPDVLAASNGHASYYSFAPEPGLRYIVLDTNAEAGIAGGPGPDPGTSTDGSQGNLDDPQFQWLRGELESASAADELIMVFAHHPIATMTNTFPDETTPCTTNDSHGHDFTPTCDLDPRPSTPLHYGDDFEALLHEFPHVIAYVAGHAHVNKISLFEAPNGAARGAAKGEGTDPGDSSTRSSGPGDPGAEPAGGIDPDRRTHVADRRGFWQVETPAIADWPVQTRLIELFDNRDGTLSIFGTLLDTAAEPEVPPTGTPGDSMTERVVAAVHRAMAYNDPQVDAEARRNARDRNTELLVDDPRTQLSRCEVKLVGTDRADRLQGGPLSDRLKGKDGSDRIISRGGDDCVNPGGGRDTVQTAQGADRINAIDGERDDIECGAGNDRVRADAIDRISRDCEKVALVG